MIWVISRVSTAIKKATITSALNFYKTSVGLGNFTVNNW